MDPTAPDIHVGHLVVLDVLRMFQDEGHTAVLIVGDYTALIGDPSGRSQTRPVLSTEQVEANARTYFEQAFRILDRERTEIHGNSEWLGAMSAADILRLLSRQTLQSVLQREDFAQRLRGGQPIGAHEILYPFNQAYDSVAVKADLEIGGTDQLFNLLYGREIMTSYGLSPQDVAVFPLLEGLDGTAKMSKSLGNYIGITEAPNEIYGKVMSIPDSLTGRYAELLLGRSDLPDNPRDAKAAVAAGLVARLHGEEAAVGAGEDFNRRFRDRQAPAEIEDFQVAGEADLVTVLVDSALARSRSEARRLISQSGVRVNGRPAEPELILHDGDVVQVGKRRFIRARL
jgi:tyrosyl-tRNA synthetase